MSGRRVRRLSDEDARLWALVTAGVTPLDPRAGAAAAPATREPPPAGPPSAMPSGAVPPGSVPAGSLFPAPARPAAPPLAAIEKGLKRKLARGRAEVEARLDLHGLTQEAAHRRLAAFLRKAQADGLKLVVVITGKGASGEPVGGVERGVLRRVVPHWLGLPDMRPLVVGFEQAGPAHGGAGALYVRIRRVRDAV